MMQASKRSRRAVPVSVFIERAAAITLAITIAMLAVGGCADSDRASQETVRQRLAQPEEGAAGIGTSQPAVSGDAPWAAGKPVARVNGAPIGRRALIGLLWKSRGLSLLQQMVLCSVARQEAERLNVTFTSDDIDREYDLTMQASRFNGTEPEKLTPARREQLISEWTRTRGITRLELAVAMERQALLRRIVRDRVQVTDEMLQREYARTYGEKAEVRHIQLAAPRVWQQIRQRLDQGEDFDDLVADHSQNRLSRQNRGLLPPFTADDPSVPAVFAKVAFALEPGQVSNPIEAEGSYHVLKLERRIPARDVPFEEAREELHRKVFARLIAGRMERLGERLMLQCKLQIEDPLLREQYISRRAAGKLTGPQLTGH